jgi:hypothetical protein
MTDFVVETVQALKCRTNSFARHMTTVYSLNQPNSYIAMLHAPHLFPVLEDPRHAHKPFLNDQGSTAFEYSPQLVFALAFFMLVRMKEAPNVCDCLLVEIVMSVGPSANCNCFAKSLKYANTYIHLFDPKRVFIMLEDGTGTWF